MTTGLRSLLISAVDTQGAIGTAAILITVDNAFAAAACPQLFADDMLSLDVAVADAAAGVALFPSTTISSGMGSSIANIHARITGGCLPTEDALSLDYSVSPVAMLSTW